MATYAVGDVQGCYQSLRHLLERVHFDPVRDELWLAGDLVNRGPNSLEVLRYVRSLGERATVVLGNHDVHLIQIYDGVRALRASDTVSDILDDPEAGVWVDWLRKQPLLHHSKRHNVCLVHAGIPPTWSLETACARAREGEAWLAQARGEQLVRDTGSVGRIDEPGLSSQERIGLIFQYFTMMRLCDSQDRLDLKFNGSPEQAPKGCLPWFAHRDRALSQQRIVFGHWSALEGSPNEKNLQALDTGCVWGKSLTALRLDDWQRFDCPCQPEDQPASRERS